MASIEDPEVIANVSDDSDFEASGPNESSWARNRLPPLASLITWRDFSAATGTRANDEADRFDHLDSRLLRK
jgi:hypothetical protein